MATSSITHNFILDAETAGRFVDALDESRRNYVPMGEPGNPHEIKDPEEEKAFIKRVMEKYKNYAN